MFTVYSKPNCPQCDKAKALLSMKGYDYDEKIIDVGQVKEEGKAYVSIQELKALIPNAQSVPQILKDDEVVGGYVNLLKLLS